MNEFLNVIIPVAEEWAAEHATSHSQKSIEVVGACARLRQWQSEGEHYTLDEAKVLLAKEKCRRYDHDWSDLMAEGGILIMKKCDRCGLALVPVEGT